MKIGVEVEGRLTGTKMIFCDAAHVEQAREQMIAHHVFHVYVSDNENVLDYDALGTLFHGYQVTLDCTEVKGSRPPNVNLMLREPTFEQITQLSAHDQIKFEKDRTVFVWSMEDVWRTVPQDFAGDIEL